MREILQKTSNYLSSWMRQGKVGRRIAVLSLILLIGAATSNVYAVRHQNGDVYFDIEWRQDMSAFEIKIHAVDYDGYNEALKDLHFRFGNNEGLDWHQMLHVTSSYSDHGSITGYKRSSDKGHRVWMESHEIGWEDSHKVYSKDAKFYVYIPPHMYGKEMGVDVEYKVDVNAAKDKSKGWTRVWSGEPKIYDFKTTITNIYPAPPRSVPKKLDGLNNILSTKSSVFYWALTF